MHSSIVIAGGGIGGLAAALALARKGQQATILEQSHTWSEFGAGIQLGPNVTRILARWGLEEELRRVAAFPETLQVRDAQHGRLLAEMSLNPAFEQRYHAPYATIHRADLHRILLEQVQQQYGLLPMLQCRVKGWRKLPNDAALELSVEWRGDGQPTLADPLPADALIGADGLWGRVRQQLLPGQAPPRYSGVLAYRALVAQADLPAHLRSQCVTVWMGEKLHMVHYPVCGGSHLNVVALIEGSAPQDLAEWDHSANAADLRLALAYTAPPVIGLAEAIDNWRLWPLCDRPPVRGVHEMAQDHVALLGDAAHPMRPFLAQGACMAIEDADALAHFVASSPQDLAHAFHRYAQARWQRCARVQTRSVRNGHIYHSRGLLRWGRDMALQLLGEKLLDMPWLYGYRQA